MKDGNEWRAWLILLTSLIITLTATIYVKSNIDDNLEADFNFDSNNIANRIETRLHAHALLLRSSTAFFSGSDRVTRQEWKTFIERHELDRSLPGILGVGYASIIPKDRNSEHIQNIRKEGFPNYKIWPEHEREIYSSIDFVEPFTGINLQYFGFDMLTEDVLADAMERARDRDMASISGKMLLAENNGTDLETGSFIFVPVYEEGFEINTVEQRRAAHIGWVYSACRMNDLMSGILIGRKLEMILHIYDGLIPSPDSLLFESQLSEDRKLSDNKRDTLILPIDFNGHRWTLIFSREKENIFMAYIEAWGLFIGGLTISVLLFLLTRSLINTHYNARKIAETLTVELKESENLLRTIMEASPVPLVLTKMRDGVVIIANESFGKLFKVSILDIIGQKLPDFYHNKSDKIALLKTIASGGHIDHRELILEKSDGEIFWCSISIKLVIINDEKVLIAGFHDITELKKTEEELIKHQEQLEKMVAERTEKLTLSEQKLLQSVKDISDYKLALDESSAVTISDRDGIIRYANDKFCELSKYSRDEVIGSDYTMLDADYHPEGFFDELWRTVGEGKIWRGEIKNKAKDGTFYWVDTTIVPFLDKNNEPYQSVAIKFDITERKSIEADLIKAKQAADAANRAKSEFLANMSHEIRTPMNAIIGFSELLSKSVRDEKQRAQVDSIRSSGKNLLRIINDILDLSKIEAGKIDLMPVPVNLVHLLSEIENIFAEKIKAKGIIFFIDYESLPNKTLHLDEVRCRQILFNLVGNAIKFTHEGSVSVRIDYRKNSTYEKNLDLTILVKDSGIGIPMDQQEHIFDPFKQSSGQDLHKYGGTGLGLSITKKLIERMGGSISLQSGAGQGSTFKIDLSNIPVIDAYIDNAQQYFDHSTVLFKPATVLIADDNEENRKLIVDLLEYSPLTILQTENGMEAVEKAKNHLPDLILMDLRMPVMDGYEATKILRKERHTASILIIAITASILISNKKENEDIETLFDQYLLKPLNIEQLIEMLKRYLSYESVERHVEEPHTFYLANREYKMSDELKQKLPEFIKILELEFVPEYERAIKNQVINEIEQFGINLLKISTEINCDMLIDYSNEIGLHVGNFDFEKLIHTLKRFPELVDWLKVETNSI